MPQRIVEWSFDFTRFNVTLVETEREAEQELLAVMDCSFIAKSGKATFGVDRFWNGCASRVEQGLEVSLVAVVNVATEVSYAVAAQQTLAQGKLPSFTRLDQYLHQLEHVRLELPASVRYLAVDGAYAKARFVAGAVNLKLEVISKLRCDANLRYVYTGVQKSRGRPRKYDGKVDLKDVSRFTFVETLQPEPDLYTAICLVSRFATNGSVSVFAQPPQT